MNVEAVAVLINVCWSKKNHRVTSFLHAMSLEKAKK